MFDELLEDVRTSDLNENLVEVNPEKQLEKFYKTVVGKLLLSSIAGEEWWKFWLLTNGKLIPSKSSHQETLEDADLDYEEVLEFGTARCSIIPDTGELNIDSSRKLNSKQIATLVSLYDRYSIESVILETGEFDIRTDVDSLKALDYVLTYGTLDEAANLKRIEDN